jgi:MoxR-like ATPase
MARTNTTAKKAATSTSRSTKKSTATPKRSVSKSATPRRQAAPKDDRIASIPDASYHKSYVSRTVVGNATEYMLFDYALGARVNVLIEGPTGSGKTSAALAFAAKKQLHFYGIPSNVGIDPTQLFGKYIPGDKEGTFVWQDGPVTDIVRYGGVLLINEVNFMPERVSTVLFGLLDKRRQIVLMDHKGEVIRAHLGKGFCWCNEANCNDKRVLILADMNPDYVGTRPLNEAFRNRFEAQIPWDYDPETEAQLVSSDNLRALAQQLRNDFRNGGIQTPVSTNMLQEFEMFAVDFDIEFAFGNFVNHFATDERDAVELTVNAHKANIMSDFEVEEYDFDTDGEGVDDDEAWAFANADGK